MTRGQQDRGALQIKRNPTASSVLPGDCKYHHFCNANLEVLSGTTTVQARCGKGARGFLSDEKLEGAFRIQRQQLKGHFVVVIGGTRNILAQDRGTANLG